MIVFADPARASFFVPSSRKTGARLGDIVRFEVGLIANPLEARHIAWSHRAMMSSKTLSISRDVETSLEDNVAVLVITSVQEKHYGNYTIEVDNEISNNGSLHAVFELTPTGKC